MTSSNVPEALIVVFDEIEAVPLGKARGVSALLYVVQTVPVGGGAVAVGAGLVAVGGGAVAVGAGLVAVGGGVVAVGAGAVAVGSDDVSLLAETTISSM